MVSLGLFSEKLTKILISVRNFYFWRILSKFFKVPELDQQPIFRFSTKKIRRVQHSTIKYSPLYLKTTKKVIFGSKIFKLQKIRYQYPGQNLIKNFRILQIRSKFFNIPKPNPPPIFRILAIIKKNLEFDDRDMIQTQVEKIIDVDEKNGKSDGFCDLRSQRDINNNFLVCSTVKPGRILNYGLVVIILEILEWESLQIVRQIAAATRSKVNKKFGRLFWSVENGSKINRLWPHQSVNDILFSRK